jgi:hypothetical protein
MLECWNVGIQRIRAEITHFNPKKSLQSHNSITPSFHYSNWGGAPKFGSSHLFRVPPEKQRDEMLDSFVEDETQDNVSDQEEYIFCRQCRNRITSPAERIEVQGSHRHTFANPHGIVFEIGCFRTVEGCGHAGPASTDFSWFSGFSWRIAVCIQCLTHLGWLFASPDQGHFHGLILDRLITQ